MTHRIIYHAASNFGGNFIELIGGCFEFMGQRLAFFRHWLSRVATTKSPTATLIANTTRQDVNGKAVVLEFLDDSRYRSSNLPQNTLDKLDFIATLTIYRLVCWLAFSYRLLCW